MPVYTYRGTNRTGGAVSGEQSAGNKAELINLLRRQQIKSVSSPRRARSLAYLPSKPALTPKI